MNIFVLVHSFFFFCYFAVPVKKICVLEPKFRVEETKNEFQATTGGFLGRVHHAIIYIYIYTLIKGCNL